ncbi:MULTISPECIES: MarR family winged helix-turn-helix transcriptional regulator [Vibrio]|uniref:MarR family winged helix-turn-helix transcriptional regulator n=1 Tax=Vibrio TaxID=662 RepID=UPI000AFFAE44|nr:MULTISPECIES: MarR family transcriptional regulator [Vibrio]MCS0353463.1 MarR family transcriptional regulator [Vibrio ordalii]
MNISIEEVIEQWLSVDMKLNRDTIELAIFFVRFGSLLSDIRNSFCKGYGVNVSEFDVLATLFLSGIPFELTAKELKERTLLPSSGASSNRIERLNNKGLVVRRYDSIDKRSVIISLTSDGVELMSNASPEFFDEIGKLFKGLNEAQISQLKLIFSQLLP